MEEKCALCNNIKEKDSKLCNKCNGERMLQASLNRIWNRTGLTYSNFKEFSEENWIKQMMDKTDND